MFEHAVRHCLARLTDFEGRTSRELYQPFANAVLLPVGLIVTFLALGGSALFVDGGDVFVGGKHDSSGFALVVGVAVALVAIATALLAAATVRRLHDVGKSGWWYASLVAGFALGPVLLTYLRRPGDPHGNRYGPPPDEHPDRDGFEARLEGADARIAALLEARAGRPEPRPTVPLRSFGRRRS